VLTLTCQTLLWMLYDPGPEPVSEASPPILLFHLDRVNTKLSERKRNLSYLACLEQPYCSGEQTSGDQVQETRRNDEEDLDRGNISTSIDPVSTGASIILIRTIYL